MRLPFLPHEDSLLLQVKPLPPCGCLPTPLKPCHTIASFSLVEMPSSPCMSSSPCAGHCGAQPPPQCQWPPWALPVPFGLKYSEKRRKRKRALNFYLCCVSLSSSLSLSICLFSYSPFSLSHFSHDLTKDIKKVKSRNYSLVRKNLSLQNNGHKRNFTVAKIIN